MISTIRLWSYWGWFMVKDLHRFTTFNRLILCAGYLRLANEPWDKGKQTWPGSIEDRPQEGPPIFNVCCFSVPHFALLRCIDHKPQPTWLLIIRPNISGLNSQFPSFLMIKNPPILVTFCTKNLASISSITIFAAFCPYLFPHDMLDISWHDEDIDRAGEIVGESAVTDVMIEDGKARLDA